MTDRTLEAATVLLALATVFGTTLLPGTIWPPLTAAGIVLVSVYRLWRMRT
jgi:hypothetical protein